MYWPWKIYSKAIFQEFCRENDADCERLAINIDKNSHQNIKEKSLSNMFQGI